jgi:hypothetical protein
MVPIVDQLTRVATSNASRTVVHQRLALNIAQRLGCRLSQIVSPRGSARTPALRGAAVVWSLADFALLRRLRAADRFDLVPRLILDVVDSALWSLWSIDDYESEQLAVIPGTSLAIEAGARVGLRAVVVPVAHAAVLAPLRWKRGRPLRLTNLSWHVIGIAAGAGMVAYGKRRRRPQLDAFRQQLEPHVEAATLEAMLGRSGEIAELVDETQRLTVLVALSVASNRQVERVGRQRVELAERVRGRHVFLGDALLRWQRVRNDDAGLIDTVFIDLAPSASMVVLERGGVDALDAELSQLDLRGRWSGDLAAIADGGVLELRSADGEVHQISIRTAVTPPGLYFDGLPVAVAWSIGYFGILTLRSREAVPVASVVPGVVALLALARWAAGRVGHDTVSPRDRVLAGSWCATLVTAVLATRTMESPFASDGAARYPGVVALQAFCLPLAGTWKDLTLRERLSALGGVAAIAAISWVLSPRPRSLRAFAADLVWPVVASVSSSAWPASIERDIGALEAELAAAGDEIMDDARVTGVVEVLRAVRSTLDEVRKTIDNSANSIPDDLRVEIERRLSTIGAQANRLGARSARSAG